MNLTVERKSPTDVELNIEVESGRVDQAIQQAYKKLVKSFNIPGFRKGKAPMSVLERYIGREAVLAEAREHLIQSVYADAIEQQGLKPLRPGEVDGKDLEPGQPYSFVARILVQPEVVLGDYKGVVVEESGIGVTDEDVEELLTRIRRQKAQMEPTDEVTSDAVVLVDLRTECDGETLEESSGVLLDLAEEFRVAGLKEALVGGRVDDSREIQWVMGEDGPRPGREAVTFLRILEVKKPILPEVDDPFAHSLQAGWTVQDLRTALENQILREKTQQAEEDRQDVVLEQVVAQVEVAIPEALIEDYMEEAMHALQHELLQRGVAWEHYLALTGKSQDAVREQFRESAGDKAKEDLVLDAVAQAEGIEPTGMEIAVAYQQFQAASGGKAIRKKGRKADVDHDLWHHIATDLRRVKTARFLAAISHPKKVDEGLEEPIGETALAQDGSAR